MMTSEGVESDLANIRSRDAGTVKLVRWFGIVICRVGGAYHRGMTV